MRLKPDTRSLAQQFNKQSTAGKIAVGATGVALTAAAIAAGAAIADKNLRNRIGKGVKGAVDSAKEYMPEGGKLMQPYQAIAHQLKGNKRDNRSSSRSKK